MAPVDLAPVDPLAVHAKICLIVGDCQPPVSCGPRHRCRFSVVTAPPWTPSSPSTLAPTTTTTACSGMARATSTTSSHIVQPLIQDAGPLPILKWVDDVERKPYSGIEQPFVGALFVRNHVQVRTPAAPRCTPCCTQCPRRCAGGPEPRRGVCRRTRWRSRSRVDRIRQFGRGGVRHGREAHDRQPGTLH